VVGSFVLAELGHSTALNAKLSANTKNTPPRRVTYDRSLLERRVHSMFFKDTKLPNYSLDQIAHLPDYMRSMYIKHMTPKEKSALRSLV